MQKEEKSAEQILDEFEAARGKEFVFTGEMKKYNNLWAGEILGVNREEFSVIGEKGEFPINCVKIKEEQPPSLKDFAERKRGVQSSLFENRCS